MSNEARKNETTSPTATFEFRGEEFTVPLSYDDYSLEFIEAAADGKPLAIQARELLGHDQWSRVRSLGLKGADLNELFEAIEAAEGLASGNSAASSA